MKYINQSTQTLLLGIPAVDKVYHRPNFARNLHRGGCFVCSSIAKINLLFMLGKSIASFLCLNHVEAFRAISRKP